MMKRFITATVIVGLLIVGINARQAYVKSNSLVTTSLLTPGSGTGITVNTNTTLIPNLYKVTIDKTAFICAAQTCDVTLVTVPAKVKILQLIADVTQVFACSATCTSTTLSAVVGITAGGNTYLLSFDVDAATAQFGLTNATLGAALGTNASTGAPGGTIPSWTATTAVIMRLTSGTGNIGTGVATNLSTGSITYYFMAIPLQ